MVGVDIRQVESEIDESIRKVAVWNVSRDVLLKRLLAIWRDDLELVDMLAAHAVLFQVEDGFQSSVGREHLMLAGAYAGRSRPSGGTIKARLRSRRTAEGGRRADSICLLVNNRREPCVFQVRRRAR
jgi:hypothetical protein